MQTCQCYGHDKGIQERIFISGNLYTTSTRFICVRYWNVLASRGSVIPLFHEQIKKGGPVAITTEEMTRFHLPLESARPGETFVPKVPAARIVDVAKALIGDRFIKMVITGIRPWEKVHEVMVSDEEAWRTFYRGQHYAIKPMLPELVKDKEEGRALTREYSSHDS